MRSAFVLLVLPACISAEMGLDRGGAVRGRDNGGIGLELSTGVAMQTARRTAAVTYTLVNAPGATSSVHAKANMLGVRGSTQLTDDPDWRVTASIAAGDGAEAAVGVERVIWGPSLGPDGNVDNLWSAALKVVARHLRDDGAGAPVDYAGVQLSLFYAIDLTPRPPARAP